MDTVPADALAVVQGLGLDQGSGEGLGFGRRLRRHLRFGRRLRPCLWVRLGWDGRDKPLRSGLDLRGLSEAGFWVGWRRVRVRVRQWEFVLGWRRLWCEVQRFGKSLRRLVDGVLRRLAVRYLGHRPGGHLLDQRLHWSNVICQVGERRENENETSSRILLDRFLVKLTQKYMNLHKMKSIFNMITCQAFLFRCHPLQC